MARETVLYYHPEGDLRTAAVKSVLVRMGVRIKNVAAGSVGQTVGYLLGRKGYEEREAPEAPELAEPLLLLDGFNNKRLEILLRELKKSKTELPYKAVVTETNLGWLFYMLYEELEKEHEAVSG